MTVLPSRTRDYVGPITDSRIWSSFDLRDSDIVLSTPPKCGTTWSQAILMMLIHGQAVKDRQVWQDSIWLDCGFRGTDKQKEALDAQTHRRCIKSHTPFDAISYHNRVTYISVYRHPIDMHFSMMKHVSNMKADALDFLLPSEPGAAFARFLYGPETDMGTDDLTLASLLHHYRSFARFTHLPNVHMYHYADLTADLSSKIRAYAAAIGVVPSDALVSDITDAASFGAMKETTRLHDNGSGAFKVQHAFFDSATSNKWEGRLSEAELAAYKKRLDELATADEVAFLENGTAHG